MQLPPAVPNPQNPQLLFVSPPYQPQLQAPQNSTENLCVQYSRYEPHVLYQYAPSVFPTQLASHVVVAYAPGQQILNTAAPLFPVQLSHSHTAHNVQPGYQFQPVDHRVLGKAVPKPDLADHRDITLNQATCSFPCHGGYGGKSASPVQQKGAQIQVIAQTLTPPKQMQEGPHNFLSQGQEKGVVQPVVNSTFLASASKDGGSMPSVSHVQPQDAAGAKDGGTSVQQKHPEGFSGSQGYAIGELRLVQERDAYHAAVQHKPTVAQFCQRSGYTLNHAINVEGKSSQVQTQLNVNQQGQCSQVPIAIVPPVDQSTQTQPQQAYKFYSIPQQYSKAVVHQGWDQGNLSQKSESIVVLLSNSQPSTGQLQVLQQSEPSMQQRSTLVNQGNHYQEVCQVYANQSNSVLPHVPYVVDGSGVGVEMSSHAPILQVQPFPHLQESLEGRNGAVPLPQRACPGSNLQNVQCLQDKNINHSPAKEVNLVSARYDYNSCGITTPKQATSTLTKQPCSTSCTPNTPKVHTNGIAATTTLGQKSSEKDSPVHVVHGQKNQTQARPPHLVSNDAVLNQGKDVVDSKCGIQTQGRQVQYAYPAQISPTEIPKNLSNVQVFQTGKHGLKQSTAGTPSGRYLAMPQRHGISLTYAQYGMAQSPCGQSLAPQQHMPNASAYHDQADKCISSEPDRSPHSAQQNFNLEQFVQVVSQNRGDTVDDIQDRKCTKISRDYGSSYDHATSTSQTVIQSGETCGINLRAYNPNRTVTTGKDLQQKKRYRGACQEVQNKAKIQTSTREAVQPQQAQDLDTRLKSASCTSNFEFCFKRRKIANNVHTTNGTLEEGAQTKWKTFLASKYAGSQQDYVIDVCKRPDIAIDQVKNASTQKNMATELQKSKSDLEHQLSIMASDKNHASQSKGDDVVMNSRMPSSNLRSDQQSLKRFYQARFMIPRQKQQADMQVKRAKFQQYFTQRASQKLATTISTIVQNSFQTSPPLRQSVTEAPNQDTTPALSSGRTDSPVDDVDKQTGNDAQKMFMDLLCSPSYNLNITMNRSRRQAKALVVHGTQSKVLEPTHAASQSTTRACPLPEATKNGSNVCVIQQGNALLTSQVADKAHTSTDLDDTALEGAEPEKPRDDHHHNINQSISAPEPDGNADAAVPWQSTSKQFGAVPIQCGRCLNDGKDTEQPCMMKDVEVNDSQIVLQDTAVIQCADEPLDKVGQQLVQKVLVNYLKQC